jgi:hypothetical protein
MDYTCRQQPSGLDLVTDGARTAKIGLRRRCAAAETSSSDHPTGGRAPVNPSHPICIQRVGLDHGWDRSEPRDLDPTDGVHAYRFARGFKSEPSVVDPAHRIRSELSESQERRIKIQRLLGARTPSRNRSNPSR